MNIHGTLVPYDIFWSSQYEDEAKSIFDILGSICLDIQHIGSTSVPGLSSKPIIDIMALIASSDEADAFIEPLAELGYVHDQAASSSERHFFRKYEEPHAYHLSIAYQDKGSFWKRQLMFRDYLRNDEGERKRYQALKMGALAGDPSGRGKYMQDKADFWKAVEENTEEE